MEASTGPRLPPPAPPNAEQIKRKLLRHGVSPTPKIIHTIRKKELQKLNRREAKLAAKQPLPAIPESQKQALLEETHFQAIKSEYRSFTNAIDGEKGMVGRPWERLEKFKLREIASENKEYDGRKLKAEHLRELSDIVENERKKLQWLLDDDVEVEDGLLQNETSTWAPPHQPEAVAIRIFLDRYSCIEPSVKNWKFSRVMKLSGLQFTERQMLKIVEELGKRGKWRHALSLVRWDYDSTEQKNLKSRFVYTKLLAVLGTARKPDEVIRVFKFMQRDARIYPDMAAYRCAAVALGQAGLLKELFKVIESMRQKPKNIKNVRHNNWGPTLQPDVVVFNAVLNACVATRHWKGVSWVFEELRKNGLRPNGATYGLSMEVMMECGKYELVHEIFGKLKRSGAALNGLTYKVLVQTFWKEGKVNEAVQAVRDMEAKGIIGVACVYYELARCLCFHRRCEEAILEAEKLRKIPGAKPLEVAFTGMIMAAMDGGDITGCLALFEHCKKCIAPDIGIINAMLKVFSRNDMFLEAKELFEVINREDKLGSTILPNEWGSSLSPDFHTFSIMLDTSASALQWEYFEYVYKEMTFCKYQPDRNRHAPLLVEASKAGKYHLLEHAFDSILEAGEIPHSSLFMEMLCQSIIKEDQEGAFRIISTIGHAPFQVTEQQWIDLFEQNRERIGGSRLKQLSDSINSHHLASSEASILNLSRALESVCRSVAGDSHRLNDAEEEQREGSGGRDHLLRTAEDSEPSFAPNNWTINSSDIDNDGGDLDVDVDELSFEVEGDEDGDFHASKMPSANEILKTWQQEMRPKDGNFFSFPLRSS